MKRLMIAAAVLACACTPPAEQGDAPPANAPVADGAGNRMEALIEDGSGRFCTADGVWCIAGDGVVNQSGQERARIPLASDGAAVWPSIVREGRNDARVLVGFTRTAEQMYSGGGGSATHLTLYDGSTSPPRILLTAPLNGSLMTRACFDEDDQAARRGACHDEYEFTGTLALDESVTEGPPRLVFTTEATTYPGQLSRTTDSTEAPALEQSDLVRWRDETCSYRRVATRRGDAYIWDAPLPACADYLEP